MAQPRLAGEGPAGPHAPRGATMGRMRAVVQRVSRASVSIDGEVVGAIDKPGLVVLVGATHSDTTTHAEKLALSPDPARDVARTSVGNCTIRPVSSCGSSFCARNVVVPHELVTKDSTPWARAFHLIMDRCPRIAAHLCVTQNR